MTPFFNPLSAWELALLLTTFTHGGTEDVSLLTHINEPSRGRLLDKAAKLNALNPKERLPLVVQSFKMLMENNGLHGAHWVEPSQLVRILQQLPPPLLACICAGLPNHVVRSLFRRLPSGLKEALPTREQTDTIPHSLNTLVRQLFESQFAPMPAPSNEAMRCTDMVHLERSDLYHLIRDLGLVELGQTFLAIGEEAVADLCRKLPRSDAQELIAVLKVSAHILNPDKPSAEHFLSHILMNFENTDELLQTSGLWHLAVALLLEDTSIINSIVQRIPWTAAQQLRDYIEKAQAQKSLWSETQLHAQQDSIVVRMLVLDHLGVINVRKCAKLTLPPHFFDPQTAQTGLTQGQNSQLFYPKTLPEN